ncbi:MAG TPA: DUF4150 domain-containing protein [Acidobacteriota bacterium]|nr:DUF4150 domain-containing protein [Acidobacteriota bacterium]HOT02492.1 DUF4150 domain-containing protein [Acidobacteriota bacterium]HQF86037.1 DUF4150 domain-containing protein [Acidobacteriota bacterium]HQG90720.1 DUF4150 domain-containing protein [Acidobacteriota bacterium]HQK87497.1 DUF4150 domain-containing protein [Acidobacteriota bacterium]
MFMLSMGAGMNLGFPDVCLTPIVVPTPIPYPDMQFSATSAPAAYNVLVDCMPAVNQLSIGTVSVGDNGGVLLGVVSHMMSGQTEYLVGCITIMVDGVPAQRLTSVTGQNCLAVLPNAPGVSLVPSQVTVLTLG